MTVVHTEARVVHVWTPSFDRWLIPPPHATCMPAKPCFLFFFPHIFIYHLSILKILPLFAMRLAVARLVFTVAVLLRGPALAWEALPPPVLRLNASQSITVDWQPAVQPDLSYQLHVTVQRRGRPAFHVTKQAAAGTHSLFWGEMPEDAKCCFRVAALPDDPTVDGEEVLYSEETCFSSFSCPDPVGPPPQGSCVASSLGGVLLGAALALLGCSALLLRPEWLQAAKQHAGAWARTMMGGAYSHLTTHEEYAPTAGPQGFELERIEARAAQAPQCQHQG